MVEPQVVAPAARYASYDREIITWMDLFLTSEGLRRCTLYVFIAYITFRLFVPLFDERKIERDRMWRSHACLLYTSDAADDLLCVDLGGRRIIKKKKK